MDMAGKERYIDRWRRDHPELRLYLNRDEYEFLKSLAESRGVSMKEIVLNAVRGIYESSVVAGLDLFIDDPAEFYSKVVERARERGIESFEPALFTAPCKKCGKPIIFTHKSPNWKTEIRQTLREAFKDYYHMDCILHLA